MGNRIFDKACEHIKRYKLINEGDSIVAGISGGADSICMLKILLKLRASLKLELIAAHVNHGIRGDEAQRDAIFVKEFCADNSVTFELAEADIPRIAAESGTTCEEAGRNYRYDFFCRVATKYGAGKIAVAHNSGDNAETVLFNIFRGSGLGGLKGILPMRSVKDKTGREYVLIRPVLSLSRKEIEEYLSESGQGYCTDSTNYENEYARNRIRNTILPLAAESVNSNAAGHIGALSRQVSEVYDYLLQETEKKSCLIKKEQDVKGETSTVRIDGAAIREIHSVIRKNLIRSAFEMVAGRLKDVEETHILAIEELLMKQSGRRLSLPYGVTALKEYDDIVLSKKPGNTAALGAHGDIDKCSVSLKIIDRNNLPGEIPKKADEKWFDYDKIGGEPELRYPMEGDYLLIGKEKHKKSLSRLLIDNKIPQKDRDNILVMAVGNHILWAVGIRQDESCYVTAETKKILIAKKIVSEKVKE